MAILDNMVLSCFFVPSYMDLELASRLALVSRQFQIFSRRHNQALTELDVKQVLETCPRPEIFLSTMPDQLPNLHSVVNVEPGWMASVNELANLSAVHVTQLKLCPASFDLLIRLPRLRSLHLDEVLSCEDFHIDAEPRKLSLNHLTIVACQNLDFLSVCRLEQLMSLKVYLPTSGSRKEHEAACQQLQRCVNLEQLTVLAQLRPVALQPLFPVVTALPRLDDFSLEGTCDKWSDFQYVRNNVDICQNLTRLQIEDYKECRQEQQTLVAWKFPKLRHLLVRGRGANVTRIFAALPALVSLNFQADPVFGILERERIIRCHVQSRITKLVT